MSREGKGKEGKKETKETTQRFLPFFPSFPSVLKDSYQLWKEWWRVALEERKGLFTFIPSKVDDEC